ncbi:MAG TPA: cysteine--tRNA ligase [candidate division Zixibacteria bacterium]|nr:cysteine--tRNA ligase [candidate division Zixibacteria bacterium]
MAPKFFNTLTRTLEEFKPINGNSVGMYTCGPTVYGPAHIGNFRAYVFEDILRRYLKYKGYSVKQVMNLTDIDDKTIRDSQAAGISLDEHTKKFKDQFFKDIDRLNIERAELYPEATKHIPEMVILVQKLLDNGHAYYSGGSFYFKISTFPKYGALFHMDIESLKAGARIDNDEYEKETASDFAIWKGWSERDGDVYWETELGKGRPGWHIECSAMSMKYLGEHFDIHTGGVDNIFPHHENEIAQSEGATGKKFVNYWLHNAHLLVENRKMARRDNNFYTLEDLVKMGHNPVAVRYLLLSTHYRQQLNFTFEGLEGAKNAITRLRDFKLNVESAKIGPESSAVKDSIEKAVTEFEAGLDDDLNISPTLASVFDFVREINAIVAEQGLSESNKKKVIDTLKRFDSVLGVIYATEDQIDERVEKLINERIAAKKIRDFKKADQIRADLLSEGIILEDTATGTVWKRKL